MAVSLRVTGTWAELTADGAVAIPATPQAGDRMYLFARWKDFSVTAQVTSPVTWTEITEFADGTTSAGNGTGSVKVACWYRDWQSGDTDPTIDFSASPDNASVVIMVMQKAAEDVWTTPIFKTAAMTNWTTSSQIVAASATAVVPSGGVVMGLIGIRDDTAVMTRPTTGIDDSTGAVTWNGDYVESPATHHSTTTGFDGAADLGYRLVSVGATATLRMTGTISAAETGAALWVVQGIEINLTFQNSAHAHSAENVALAQVHILTVQSASHAQSAESLVLTQVHVLTIQNGSHAHSAESLSLTQVHELVTANASHDHSANNLTITQTHVVVVQDAGHAHVSESLTLEIIHNLITQDAGHAHTVESLTLTQVHEIAINGTTHAHTAGSPNVKGVFLIWLDPGGDAVQAAGYFNTIVSTPATFDSAQQVIGVGSYKFDSEAGSDANASIQSVLGAARRVSSYFRYDSVPDEAETEVKFAASPIPYSGGGFADPANLNDTEGDYATATPARNAGQGGVAAMFATTGIPIGAVIDSVKIIYDRKYDVNTSIGISRVKYEVNGVEGPAHDNTDMPLTDTVVTVDVTTERGWTWQDFRPSVFRVIAEARRGDTDTAHTQSWDYVKVEVEWHAPTKVLAAMDGSNHELFSIALNPKGAGGVVRFTDAAGDSYDGITQLAVNTWNRISFSYVLHAADDLDIKVYVNGIEELSIVSASTGGFTGPLHLLYGWFTSPGVDHLCWFDQLYIDDGDDLSDPGNMLITAKLSDTVDDDEWNTTGGTGAVNERPLSETNHRKETRTAAWRQTYAIQAASAGDVDLTGKTIVGHMGWVWGKIQSDSESAYLVANGTDILTVMGSTPQLLKKPITSAVYPANPIGMATNPDSDGLDVTLFECGIIVAYLGPARVDLLNLQSLTEGSITDLSDDLGVEDAATYTLRSEVEETDALVTTTISSSDVEGDSPQQQAVIESHGDEIGHTVIAPGHEVTTRTEVTGADAEVGLARIPDVE